MPDLLWNNIENARQAKPTWTPFWSSSMMTRFKISICSWSTIIETLCFMSQKICQIDFSWWIAPQILATPTGQKSRSPNFQFVWRTFAKNPLFSPSKGCLCSWAKSLEGAGGCLEVGWYWIVLEGEERGCGGVYHPWGNLILRRKPLQVSLNMPHTHIPSKHSRTKGGENFFVRFICGQKMTILRHRAGPPEACQAFIFPLM